MKPASTSARSTDKSGVRRTFDSQASVYGEYEERSFEGLLFEFESREIIERLRRLRGNVLDLGTGRGRYIHGIVDGNPLVRSVVGVDLSRRMLEAARSTVQERDVHFVLADGASLPLKRESLDAIVAVRSVKYNPDWRTLFAECSRVLRPAGVLVLYEVGRSGSLQALGEKLFGTESDLPLFDISIEALIRVLQGLGFASFDLRTYALMPVAFYQVLGRFPSLQRVLFRAEWRLLGNGLKTRCGNNILLLARKA